MKKSFSRLELFVPKVMRARNLGVHSIFVLLFLQTAISELAPAGRELQSVSSSPKWPKQPDQDILIISLLDGRVVAVDPSGGSVLWSFDSGSPLLSVQQSEASPPGVHIFPGVDGGLYAYHGLDSNKARLERLPITLPELVESSPSLTDDGSIIVGNRKSSVFMLDVTTGRLVQALSGSLEDRAEEAMRLQLLMETERTIVLGREDYVVRSIQRKTGTEAWNATFGRILRLSSAATGTAPHRPNAKLPRFTVTTDSTLQAFDSDTGFLRWSISFDVPPVAAYSSEDAAVNQLDPSAPFRAASASLRRRNAGPVAAGGEVVATPHRHSRGARGESLVAPGRIQPVGGGVGQGDGGGNGEERARSGQPGTRVLVGVIAGSPYAMPADHLVFDESLEDEPEMAEKKANLLPAAAPLALSGAADGSDQGQEGAVRRSTALAPVPRTKHDAVFSLMSPIGADGGLENGGLLCPTGLHMISAQGESSSEGEREQISWLPNITSLPSSSAVAERKQAENVPAVLVIGAQEPKTVSGFLLLVLTAVGTVLVMVLISAVLLRGGFIAKAEFSSLDNGSKPAIAAVITPSSLMTKSPSKPPLPPSAKVAGKSRRRSRSRDDGGAPPLSNGDIGGGVAAVVAVISHRDSSSGEDRSSAMSLADRATPVYSSGKFGVEPSNEETISSTADGYSMIPGGQPLSGGPSTASAVLEAVQRSSSSMTSRYAKLQSDGSLSIGRLKVGPGILGYGSAGTVVYEGTMDGRSVAVKRLLRQFYDLAKKEIEVLIMSDEHPNVVRCFAMEEDREFVYLALERCRSTLNDFLGTSEGREAMVAQAVPGRPGPTVRCIEIMEQVASGLAALHERGIVHRDLKPHNVLITDTGRAKLSDMGLSKQLIAEQSSFESHGAGGSSGWQAPEQLIARDGGTVRQTRSMDIFSLGCVLHYVITGGRHPFGDSYARDSNILHSAPDLSPLGSHQAEAANLLSAMMNKDAAERPTMPAVLAHPLWWSAEQQLQFLVDISDRIESEDREPDQAMLQALESRASVGIGANWGSVVDTELVANLGRYRRYDFTSLRDLLRVVRNKRSHFREMPAPLQAMLGSIPTGFVRYFTSRFPNLLMTVYIFALQQLHSDAALGQYWPCGVPACGPFIAAFARTHSNTAAAGVGGRHRRSGTGGNVAARGGLPTVPEIIPFKGATASRNSNASEWAPEAESDGNAAELLQEEAVGGSLGDGAAASSTPPPASRPPRRQTPRKPAVVGYEVDPDGATAASEVREFPQRPGKQPCDFYVKTGHCKFGDTCVNDHPPQYAVPLTATMGLPLRPDQLVCTFYIKHNQCKFGPVCRFHHPPLVPIYAGSLAAAALEGEAGIAETSAAD